MSVIPCPSTLQIVQGSTADRRSRDLPAGKIPEAGAAANHFEHGIGVAEGARWRNRRAQVLCKERAMPALMQNEGHMNAVKLWNRRALGFTRIADALAWRLPQHGVKVTTTKAANFAC